MQVFHFPLSVNNEIFTISIFKMIEVKDITVL
jgi:hypothetical protein